MLFPNKLYPFSDTIVNKSIFILKELKNSNYRVLALYKIVKKYFDNILEYQESLDFLYALNKIDLMEEQLCLKE